jgi:hypothetical protein
VLGWRQNMNTNILITIGDTVVTLTETSSNLYRLTFHDTFANKSAHIDVKGTNDKHLMLVAVWLAACNENLGDLEPYLEELLSHKEIAENFMP